MAGHRDRRALRDGGCNDIGWCWVLSRCRHRPVTRDYPRRTGGRAERVSTCGSGPGRRPGTPTAPSPSAIEHARCQCQVARVDALVSRSGLAGRGHATHSARRRELLSATTWLVVAMSTWTSDWIRRMDDRDTLGVVDGVSTAVLRLRTKCSRVRPVHRSRCGDHPGTVLFRYIRIST